jgi:hypothetical protein
MHDDRWYLDYSATHIPGRWIIGPHATREEAESVAEMFVAGCGGMAASLRLRGCP